MSVTVPIKRSEPTVWVRRLILFRTLAPLAIIRDIPLRRGLNIIQGLGTGHAVGKSTCCRLIRHCLGESEFTEPGRRADIELTFPDGAVGAEVVVAGKVWTVLRPFTSQRGPRASIDLTFADLATAPTEANHWQDYQDALATTTLGRLPTPLTLSDGTAAHWLNILAACTRDQSTRLSDVLTWRPTKVPSRKEDRSAIYRILLGLIDPLETAASTEVARINSSLTTVTAQRIRREHDSHVRFLDHWPSLARDQALTQNSESAWDSQDLGDELLRVAVNRLRHVDQERLSELDAHMDTVHDRRARDRLAIAERERELHDLANARQTLTLAARGDPDARQRRLNDLDKKRAAGATCQHLDQIHYPLLLTECPILTDKLTNLRADYQATGAWDAAANQRNDAQLGTLRDLETTLRADRDTHIAERNRTEAELTVLEHERRAITLRLDRLNDDYQRITASLAVRSGTDAESVRLHVDQLALERDLEAAQARRAACLAQAQQKIAEVQMLYHGLVQAIAGPAYRGQVDLAAGTITLSLGTSTAAGGETYKALTVPIADLAALLRGIAGHSIHPGFLIHDCPREADMNADLYRRIFEVAKSLEDAHGGSDHAAFQYIITTTTPPPESLATDPWMRQTLDGESADGLLFRQRIASAKQESYLPPDEVEGE